MNGRRGLIKGGASLSAAALGLLAGSEVLPAAPASSRPIRGAIIESLRLSDRIEQGNGNMAGEQQLAEALEALRSAHVGADGACDFPAMIHSREHGHLAATLGALGEFDPRKMRLPAQNAFWLNLHNGCVLRDALELHVQGFAERSRIRVAGFSWSLHDIEHGLLRGNMKKSDPRLAFMPVVYDERMHFGIYTARRSSPPLQVFRPDRFEDQLEEATERYLRGAVQVRDEQFRVKLVVPKLFKLYGEDFGRERDVLEFVLARLDDQAAELVDRREGRFKFKYVED